MHLKHHFFFDLTARVFPSFNLNVEKRNFSSIVLNEGSSNSKEEESIPLRISRNNAECKEIDSFVDNKPIFVRIEDALMRRHNKSQLLSTPTVYSVSMNQGQAVSKLLKILRSSFFSKEMGIETNRLPLSPSYIFYFFSNVFMLSDFKQNLQILPLNSLVPFKNLRYLATKVPFIWKSKIQYYMRRNGDAFRFLSKKSYIRYLKPGNQFFFSIIKSSSSFSKESYAGTVDFNYLKSKKKKKKFKLGISFNKVNLLWHSVYKDPVVEKFINCIMKHGRRVKAENLFIKTLVYLKEFTKRQPILIVHKALQFCQPILEARALMGSRKAHFIPKEVTLRRRVMIAVKSIIKVARENTARKQPFFVRLAHELLLAANDDGKAIEKVKSIHEKAFSNRANLRYSGSKRKRKR